MRKIINTTSHPVFIVGPANSDDDDDILPIGLPPSPFVVALLFPTYTNLAIEVGTTNTSFSMASFRYDVTIERMVSSSTVKSERDDVVVLASTVSQEDATSVGRVCWMNTVTPPNIGAQITLESKFVTLDDTGC
jgi:hypothetical protein